MKKITSTTELTEIVCGIINADAYGGENVTVHIKENCRLIPMLGGSLRAVSASVTAKGYEDRSILTARLDRAASMAEGYRGHEGILRLCPISPAVLRSADKCGFAELSQEYTIIYEGEYT